MSSNRRSPQNRQRTPQTESVAPVTVSTNPQPDEPKLPLERIGDMLKRIRTERGDDLQQIADYLCIRKSFLVALENNRYEEFPADAYVIGFLRSYAEYLGVNSKEAIDRYRNEMAGRRKKPALMIPAPITEGRTPSGAIMAGTAVAALLIYALWYGFSSSDRTTVTTPPALPTAAAPATETPSTAESSATTTAPAPVIPPDTTTTAPTPTVAANTISTAPLSSSVPANDAPAGIALQGPAPSAQMPMAPSAPAPTTPSVSASTPSAAATAPEATTPPKEAPAEKEHLTIRATQATWVLVTDSKGHPVYDHVMKPGEVYKVPHNPNLVLTTGNGSGIILSLDGRDLPRLTTGSSHVVRNVPLDDQSLRSLPSNSDD